MALNSAQQWWVRSDGAETNGGGFDATVSGAGTNYSDQASPQLSITDLATTGASASVISALSTFTSAMVGNVIRIASGINFTAGYYVIVTFTDATHVTLDRVCSTGVGASGVAKVGGAHASLVNYSNGGSGIASPAIGTPIAPGHIINMRGVGTSDPTGTVQYDYSSGYWTFPNGDATNGPIKVLGYNGKPFIGTSPLLIYSTILWSFKNISVKVLASTYASHGFTGDTQYHVSFIDSYMDGNGADVTGVFTVGEVLNSRFKNTGTIGSTSTYGAVGSGNANFGVTVIGCTFKGWRSHGVYLYKPLGATILFNVFISCMMDGIYHDSNSGVIPNVIFGNTIYNCRDGISINGALGLSTVTIINNILSNNTGYGINANFGSLAANDSLKARTINYNNFYLNTSGARNKISAGVNDTALDPQFRAVGADDFSVGTNMKAIGFPGAFPLSGSTSYTDLGAVQRQEKSFSRALDYGGL